ncbi:MAG: hypothetical protein ACKVP4_04830 [Hyphomicrobium sp.]
MTTLKTALVVLLALAATADVASARRMKFRLFSGSNGSSHHSADAPSKKSKLPIVVPIPGGSSGNIVKVLDLPDTALFRRPDGRYVDLGYRFTSGDAGDWVGYVGSSTQYLPLSKDALNGMMMVAGLKELPPPPTRTSSGGMVALLIVAGVIGFGVLKRFVFGAARTVAAATSEGLSSQTPDWVARAEERVASSAQASPAPTARRDMGRATAAAHRVGAVSAPRSAFGRRA